MNKEITVGPHTISCIFKPSARARHLRIAIGTDARVTVTHPAQLSAARAEWFVRQKADWIITHVEKMKRRPPRIALPQSVSDFHRHRHRARALVRDRIAILNQVYQFSFARISIKNHGSRWGSCSREGNLNFNYRLIFLPIELVDYVIVHELCHLRELNHSQKFWALVERVVPNHKALRRAIQTYHFGK